MKIVCFYPENVTSAWSASTGVAETLERMGHQILRTPLLISEYEMGKLPTLDLLEHMDLVLLLGPEHYGKMLDGYYSSKRWLGLKVPKAAWFHESAFRDDAQKISVDMLWLADEHFFPAAQDADFFDQAHLAGGHATWLPFGVDSKIFYAVEGLRYNERRFGVAFMGGMYPKRMEFIQGMARHLTEAQVLTIGNAGVQDLSGYLPRASAELYASNLRDIQVFINFPALSRLLVTKVFEVMACGTALLTSTLTGEAAANMKLFKNHEHLEWYSEKNPAHAAKLMRDLLADPGRCAVMGAKAALEIAANHSLEKRLEKMFEKLKMEAYVGRATAAVA